MELQTSELASYLRGFTPKTKAPPRQRGRPRERGEALFARVMRGHLAISQWFAQHHGRAARSDVELYTAFREYVLEAANNEPRAVCALTLGYTMKTVQNLLGEARRYFRNHPEKCPFLGVDGVAATASNTSSESDKP